MENCIVGLCQNAREGEILYRTLDGRHGGTMVFCIFYGATNRDEISNVIPRERRVLLPTGSSVEAAIRSAMIWVPRLETELENLVFCYADAIPSQTEIERVLSVLSAEGTRSATQFCWGLSLTSAILEGWGSERRCSYTPFSDIEKLAEMGKAMRGEPVDVSIMARAVVEVMPDVILVQRQSNIPPCAEFAARVDAMVSGATGAHCGYLIPQDYVPSQEMLLPYLKNLQTGEVVGVICYQSSETMKDLYARARPHRVLQATNGITVLFFGANSITEEKAITVTGVVMKAGIVNANIYPEKELRIIQ